ncbi:hypothetical protein SERLA73DRAFT_79787 [Serpula lacrymans var. lacrymans S7.3]|uniref:Uncharacterized protein n=2 Tax=Serpula lacrymans var. lacrymans TaxID=341189 RepID=F8QHK5_SERL3|nr:uncharacterized protein SERLADRAFT_440151 [Serpula lacrymans var. lacrymans S7.9]EGN92182.1 hypothetical protein SERLA73DRAFT_79787 [Serpula lacrymans var. lacrymans S7.3]EGO22133.1 hypothetical protein SERLADRAFT_440151 [Serpula lacrymans var. lacrymans S7.9]
MSMMQRVMEPVAQAMQGKTNLEEEKLAVQGGKMATKNAKYTAIAERTHFENRKREKETVVLQHKWFKEKVTLITKGQIKREREQRQHEKDMLRMKFELIQAVKC